MMKNIKCNMLIIGTMAITVALWLLAQPKTELNFFGVFSHAVGGVSLSGFFLVFLLSIRSRTIEKWFNGMENVYKYHKWLAIGSIAAVLLHSATIKLGFTDDVLAIRGPEMAAKVGGLSQNFFILLTLVALLAKKMKYENWRFFHRLFIVPYAFGLFHTFKSSWYDLQTVSPLSIWIAVTGVIGMASALYMLFFYQRVQFNKNKGTITGIRKFENSVIELEMTMDKPFDYKAGQYIFLKVFQKGLESAPHPFSISGGAGHKIYVAVKILGDFTQDLYDNVQVGTSISMDGPFGHMIFDEGKEKQVWVAAGIGIAPFISYLDKNAQLEQNVALYYSYRGQQGAVYRKFLEDYQAKNPNLTVHFHDTAVLKRLDFRDYPLKNEDVTIFMCGPDKMITGFANYFKKHYGQAEIIFEAFKFA